MLGPGRQKVTGAFATLARKSECQSSGKAFARTATMIAVSLEPDQLLRCTGSPACSFSVLTCWPTAVLYVGAAVPRHHNWVPWRIRQHDIVCAFMRPRVP